MGRVRAGRLLVAALGELDVFEDQLFFVAQRRTRRPAPLPGGHVSEMVIVAKCFALFGLALGAEVAAAGLFAFEGIASLQLCELEEVGDTPDLFE